MHYFHSRSDIQGCDQDVEYRGVAILEPQWLQRIAERSAGAAVMPPLRVNAPTLGILKLGATGIIAVRSVSNSREQISTGEEII